jgi:Fur family zinc uptake transcriptional regulator
MPQARSRTLSPTQERVLALLSEATRPLTAYDLLGLLRSEGVNAPPTVYRALDRLMREGLAHRIESLNAFVACNRPHHHDLAAFAICDDCGLVSEVTDTELEGRLGSLAARSGFHVARAMVELRGHCAACAGHRCGPEAGHAH